MGRWKFPQVRAIADFAIEEVFIGLWESDERCFLTILIFLKAKNNIL